MTKKEIVRQISERIHETQLKTKEIVQLTFDAIVDTLIADRRIELRNFGVFEVKLRKPRKARNPRTSDPVQVPAMAGSRDVDPGAIAEEPESDQLQRKSSAGIVCGSASGADADFPGAVEGISGAAVFLGTLVSGL